MSDEFAVEPDKLAEFQEEVGKVAADYAAIVAQLDQARLSDRMDLLVGAPQELGPSGPPVAFTEASGDMLSDLDSMLGALHRLHAAVLGRFRYMTGALEETRALYVQADNAHAGVFRNLLDLHSSEGS